MQKDEAKVVAIAETARHLATSDKAVKGLLKIGALVGVRLPGRKRLSGVTVESLNKLIAQSALAQK